MGYHNPPIPWRELEGTLSGRPQPEERDAPNSGKRKPYQRPPIVRPTDAVPYAELHAHSSFSFLDGASSPVELVEEAERLGLHALAVTDHDGLYGIVRFAEAAEQTGVKTIFGAELSLELPAPQSGVPDPVGSHLLVLAAGEEGYHRLAGALTHAQLAGKEKGRPHYDLDDLAERSGGHWAVLTGCRKGAVRQALLTSGPLAAARELDELVERFGRVYVELTDHGYPLDSTHNDELAAIAARAGVPVVATGNVHYATPAKHQLAQAVAAIRANRSMDALDGWLPAAGTAFLRSGAEMRARFARYPGAVERTVELADELAFPLRRAKPALPKQHVEDGHTPMSWLRHLVWQGAAKKYGHQLDEAKRQRIEHELDVIEAKDFPGYFLIVHSIVEKARELGILCQGRGSAASSAVCYVLGITAVDAIFYDLPFERFISSLRDEEPDIDVDFDSERREEIIQWVFDTYGRERVAQVCNVIQYRPKNAVRDVAKALGYSPGQQDSFARQIERWDALAEEGEDDSGIPPQVRQLATELLKAPRHLGIHSGGMVLTERPVGQVVPIEPARMKKRTVIQWDKDDAAWMGLVKFDLLGLGMLSALQYCFDLIRSSTGEELSLSNLPREEQTVYDMLCRADSIGVFQVESRAQMGLLPRLQPRKFYDLVIEIALIRPGPIQGGAVHPFVRRKLKQEEVTYPHPKLEPVLERTLGVPIFQEQLMQMAMVIGECSGEDADLLRRAMGSKRGVERIQSVRERLYAGMARNGLTGEPADIIYKQIEAFANFGFAESHSLSFALLVYASSWIKLHYPAAFLAGLLRAQPMGFYSPETLTADARRHGVEVRRPDLLRSGVHPTLEPSSTETGITGLVSCLADNDEGNPVFDPSTPDESAAHRRDGNFVVRLGLAGVRGIGEEVAKRIVAEREAGGDYASMEDLARRAGLTERQLSTLATSGALQCLQLTRRQALWRAGTAALDQADTLPDTIAPLQPPLFRAPTGFEVLADDLWSTSVSVDDHVISHLRSRLAPLGVVTSAELRTTESGRRVKVAGLVTHRQRPSTASGITFMNLEDEYGLINVICSPVVWSRHRQVARGSSALIIRGTLERSPEGVTNLLAERLEPLLVGIKHRSRDFR
ncbi:MAG: error-prone DNA polymerase [Actinobacteria bacterium]|nr:error-prone DNA polymerase [Actinomycetota bacterium]